MNKATSSVIFEMKDKQKVKNASARVVKKNDEMKVKLRQEISQVFH